MKLKNTECLILLPWGENRQHCLDPSLKHQCRLPVVYRTRGRISNPFWKSLLQIQTVFKALKPEANIRSCVELRGSENPEETVNLIEEQWLISRDRGPGNVPIKSNSWRGAQKTSGGAWPIITNLTPQTGVQGLFLAPTWFSTSHDVTPRTLCCSNTELFTIPRTCPHSMLFFFKLCLLSEMFFPCISS